MQGRANSVAPYFVAPVFRTTWRSAGGFGLCLTFVGLGFLFLATGHAISFALFILLGFLTATAGDKADQNRHESELFVHDRAVTMWLSRTYRLSLSTADVRVLRAGGVAIVIGPGGLFRKRKHICIRLLRGNDGLLTVVAADTGKVLRPRR
jgi:hypothetical protein